MRANTEAGYTLPELLTIVVIVGVIVTISIPAFMQIFPQYKLRGEAGELAATMRMARQNAMGTRSPWRIAFDYTNDRYKVMRLTGPGGYRQYPLNPDSDGDGTVDFKIAEITNAAWWVAIDRRGRELPVDDEGWRTAAGIDYRASTISNFFNTDCTGAAKLPGPDLVFLPNGAVARNGDCSAPTTDLTFESGGVEVLPEVVLAVDTNMVAFNRYRLRVRPSGQVIVTAEKE